MYRVPIGATAKRQIEPIAKANQVGECVVLAVVKDTANVCHLNFGNCQFIGVYGHEGTCTGCRMSEKRGNSNV
jgi:hypothetical protein